MVAGTELRNRESPRIQIPQVCPPGLRRYLKVTVFPKQKPYVCCLGEYIWDGPRGTAEWEGEEKGRESQAIAIRHSRKSLSLTRLLSHEWLAHPLAGSGKGLGLGLTGNSQRKPSHPCVRMLGVHAQGMEMIYLARAPARKCVTVCLWPQWWWKEEGYHHFKHN